MKKYIIIFVFATILSCLRTNAQTVVEIEPLFEYPTAPEEIESFEEKCNYLVKNFWNKFDFKAKSPVDQYALNEAFQVYSTTFRYAGENEVLSSIDKLLKDLSGNQVLMLQFCKAAEENLYGPRAEMWSDALYLKFIEAVIKDKKISEARKKKYIQQAKTLNESAVGKKAPEFWFVDKERASKRYFPMSTPTLIIFGNPDDTDWRLARIRMDTNLSLSEALEKGKVNILYIVPGQIDNWKNNVDNYNPRWTVGQSDEVANIYDIRILPSIFLVGADGNILRKNMRLEEAINLLLQQIN